MGPRFKVTSEGQEKHGIEHTTPGLEGEQFYHYTRENNKHLLCNLAGILGTYYF